MKKLLSLAIVMAVAYNAHASRARMTALGNSPHLQDTQTIYSQPADILDLGERFLALESGISKATALDNGAEAMLVGTVDGAKLGLSLGHDTDFFFDLRNNVTASFPTKSNFFQQNPIEFTYGNKAGDLNWGLTAIYSNYRSKTGTKEKEDTLGARLGLRSGQHDGTVRVGFTNNYSNTTDGKFEGTPSFGLGYGYQWGSVYLNADYKMSGYKLQNASGNEISKYTTSTIMVSATAAHKNEAGSEVFYGVDIEKNDQKTEVSADQKVTSLQLPFWMGFEVQATSWMTFRGSLKQAVLINSSKDETGTTVNSELNPGSNNTTAAMGMGLKFDKLTIDGTLKGLVGSTQNQQLDGSNLLATAGLTYLF